MKWLPMFVVVPALLAVSRPVEAQYNYNYQARASTAGESWANGISNMVRAAGENALLSSEAAINVEEARSKYLDNRLKGTETYFEMRRRNREYRAAERGPQATSEQLFRLAHQRVPSALSPSELDPVTGKIAWPVLLRKEEFGPDREVIDTAFTAWAQHQGNLPSNVYVKIQQSVNVMLGNLKRNVRKYTEMGIPASDYLAARNFLQSLLHVSRQGA